MTDVDVLAKHAARIARHERFQFADGGIGECIRDLAAALRAERERVAELERRLSPPCPDPSIDAFYLDADKEKP